MDDYLIMVEKKTGYLIGLCTELGGILGNQSDETIEDLKTFGTILGTAFQIQDDMLEIMANKINSNFKEIDNSIREQKEYLESNGIIEEVKSMIHSYINRANDILTKIPNPCNFRLKQFTELILNRDH